MESVLTRSQLVWVAKHWTDTLDKVAFLAAIIYISGRVGTDLPVSQ